MYFLFVFLCVTFDVYYSCICTSVVICIPHLIFLRCINALCVCVVVTVQPKSSQSLHREQQQQQQQQQQSLSSPRARQQSAHSFSPRINKRSLALAEQIARGVGAPSHSFMGSPSLSSQSEDWSGATVQTLPFNGRFFGGTATAAHRERSDGTIDGHGRAVATHRFVAADRAVTATNRRRFATASHARVSGARSVVASSARTAGHATRRLRCELHSQPGCARTAWRRAASGASC